MRKIGQGRTLPAQPGQLKTGQDGKVIYGAPMALQGYVID